jgi:glycosyltransferase involved in cell wall biosynthesis
MKRKAIIISNFHEDAMVSRSNMAFKYFTDRNYETIVLCSNFSHSLKEFRYFEKLNVVELKTIRYNSNLSLKRILSHAKFAFEVYKYLVKSSSDIIYLNLPPNILVLAFLFLKQKKDRKIIIDIVDLWPESFPHDNYIKKILLFFLGILPKYIRKKGIARCDYCLAESDFFYSRLELHKKEKASTIYLKKFQTEEPDASQISNLFSVAYLGNIGNIYDFESLFTLLTKIGKKRQLHLHVIGSGPMSKWFFTNLETLKINYTYHGATFDEELKKKVLPSCWFGFNGYKQDTEVALSYKSIDYLSYGVPILNSAKEDTYKLVTYEKIGFNFEPENLNELIEILSNISQTEIIVMKKKAYSVFRAKFSGQSYYDEMDSVINQIYL